MTLLKYKNGCCKIHDIITATEIKINFSKIHVQKPLNFKVNTFRSNFLR